MPGYLAGGSGGGHSGRGGRAVGRIMSGDTYGSVFRPLEFGTQQFLCRKTTTAGDLGCVSDRLKGHILDQKRVLNFPM